MDSISFKGVQIIFNNTPIKKNRGTMMKKEGRCIASCFHSSSSSSSSSSKTMKGKNREQSSHLCELQSKIDKTNFDRLISLLLLQSVGILFSLLFQKLYNILLLIIYYYYYIYFIIYIIGIIIIIIVSIIIFGGDDDDNDVEMDDDEMTDR